MVNTIIKSANKLGSSLPPAGNYGIFDSEGNIVDGGTPPSGPVLSVFGRGGNVVAQNGDYTASQVTNVPAGSIASTDVQGALNELDSEKVPYTGAAGDVDLGTNGLTANDVTLSGSTASRLLSTDSSKVVTALDTATYPSLTEISYVKGVTSSIQNQLDEIAIQTLWGYQDFAAGAITGTSVTLTTNQNGTGAALSGFYNYAAIYRSDSGGWVYTSGFLGLFQGLVDVTAQSGISITLNKIPDPTTPCRIWWAYSGTRPTSGYIIPPQDVLNSAEVISLNTLLVASSGSSTDNAVPRFNGTTGTDIKNSGITIDDSDNVDGATTINIADAPVENIENAINKAYYDGQWANRQVISTLNLTTSEPIFHVNGDRYLNTTTGTSNRSHVAVNANSIYEYIGGVLTETAPQYGMEIWDVGAAKYKFYNGSNWNTTVSVSDFSYLPSAITALTGDVTASGPGSVASTIANNAVTTAKVADSNITYAKIQNISAATRLLGRYSASAGVTQEISIDSTLSLNSSTGVLSAVGATPSGAAGGDLSGTYPNPTVAKINGATLGTTTATSGNILIGSGSAWVTNAMSGDITINSSGVTAIGANKVTDAMLRQSSGLSVIGRSANTTGNVADITAASDGQVLRRSGTSIGFGAVDLANTNSVTGILPNANTTAASANTASAIVARDGSGNFSAGTITAALSGNATTATTLQTARNINGVSFNGSADITVTAAAGTLTGTTLASNVVTSSLTSVGTIGTGVWQGTKISEVYGGTNQSSYTLGDILYSSASNTLSKLAGNTTTAKQYLSQTGNGTVSAAPAWATIDGGDITGAALTRTNDTNVTLTLGGTPTAALLRATSLTLGWTGQLGLSRGGTNADLSATGGTSQVLKQTTVGGAITVAQLAASDLSNGTSGSGAVALVNSPSFTTPNIGAATSSALTATTSVTSPQGIFTGSTTTNSQGAHISWNQLNGSTGETDFINHRGAGTGGFRFYDTNSGAVGNFVFGISPAGVLSVTDSTNTTTITPSSGGLAFNNSIALGANNLTLTGSIASSGSRVTKGWFTDLDVSNPITGSTSSISTSDESTDTSCYPVFVTTSGTQVLPAKTNTNLSFNANTGALTASRFYTATLGPISGILEIFSGTGIIGISIAKFSASSWQVQSSISLDMNSQNIINATNISGDGANNLVISQSSSVNLNLTHSGTGTINLSNSGGGGVQLTSSKSSAGALRFVTSNSLGTTQFVSTAATEVEIGANSVTIASLTASRAVVTNGSKVLTSLEYTSSNTVSTIVARDSSGNFSAGVITASSASTTVFVGSNSNTVGTRLNLANSSSGGKSWDLISLGSGNTEGAGNFLFNAGGSNRLLINGTSGALSLSDGTNSNTITPSASLLSINNKLSVGGTDSRGQFTPQITSTTSFVSNTDPGDSNRIVNAVNETSNTGANIFVAITLQASPSLSLNAGRIIGDISLVRRTSSQSTGDFYISGYHQSSTYTDFCRISYDTSIFYGALQVNGHMTVEGVTSTGATGTGKFVFDSTPTIATPSLTRPLITGGSFTNSQGAQISWNTINSGSGQTEIVNHKGLGSGGVYFYNTGDASTFTQLFFMNETSVGISRSTNNLLFTVENTNSGSNSDSTVNIQVANSINGSPGTRYVRSSVGGYISGMNTGAGNYYQICYNGSGTPNFASTLFLQFNTSGNLRLAQYGAGTLTTDSSGNVTATSDERLKTDRKLCAYGLKEILKLAENGATISYRWTEQSGMETENTYVGFSAQKSRLAIPETATLGKNGFYSFTERPITVALVNGMAEIANENTKINQRISSLGEEISQLKKQIRNQLWHLN